MSYAQTIDDGRRGTYVNALRNGVATITVEDSTISSPEKFGPELTVVHFLV